ncbi:MAG: phytanoyl-CoA dioxygenase family protein [Phycisphaerae bacterium]
MTARPETAVSNLRSLGIELETGTVGRLRDSTELLADASGLRARMSSEGYLYLPGLLRRPEVLAARREILERLDKEGLLDQTADLMDGKIRPGVKSAFRPDLTRQNAALEQLLYHGPLLGLFELFLGGPVRHLDYTWLRVISPGLGTPSHMDSVYMNRGTSELYTAWVPLGDVDFTLGGLIMLESSNNNRRLVETYGMRDVDTYCQNKPEAPTWVEETNGHLNGDPNQIRRSVGKGIDGRDGRWLTTEYKAGDVLVFSIFTVHASLDNQTADRLRISSDSRYQLAGLPVDERWIGENPIAHGKNAKKGLIC